MPGQNYTYLSVQIFDRWLPFFAKRIGSQACFLALCALFCSVAFGEPTLTWQTEQPAKDRGSELELRNNHPFVLDGEFLNQNDKAALTLVILDVVEGRTQTASWSTAEGARNWTKISIKRWSYGSTYLHGEGKGPIPCVEIIMRTEMNWEYNNWPMLKSYDPKTHPVNYALCQLERATNPERWSFVRSSDYIYLDGLRKPL